MKIGDLVKYSGKPEIFIIEDIKFKNIAYLKSLTFSTGFSIHYWIHFKWLILLTPEETAEYVSKRLLK